MNGLVGALKAGGVLLFANFNRIDVVPPLNISDQDAIAASRCWMRR